MADSLTNGPARDRFWSRACRARHPVRPGVSEPSQVRILLRPPVMPRPPRHSSVTSMVSDSGSETGAASSAHMRPAAVRCGQLDRAQCSDQHIHSSSGTLFECLRGSGRRGRRFKSGHPDRKTAGHEANRDLPFGITRSRVPDFGSQIGSGHRREQRRRGTTPVPTHRSPARQLLPALGAVPSLSCCAAEFSRILIKAAPLRSRGPARRAGLRPWGADPSRRAGQPGSSHLLARSIGSIRTHGGSGHPDRAFRCPDLSTTARMASSMAAVIRQLPAASAKRRSVPEMKGWRGKQGRSQDRGTSPATDHVALQDRPVKGAPSGRVLRMAQAPPLTVPPFQAVSAAIG